MYIVDDYSDGSITIYQEKQMWDKIDLLIRFLLIIVSLVFMILCIINQDHKLFSAIICVGGTTCLWIKKLIDNHKKL